MKQSVTEDKLVARASELADEEVGEDNNQHGTGQYVLLAQPHRNERVCQMIERECQERRYQKTQRAQLPKDLLDALHISLGYQVAHARSGTAQKIVDKLVQLGEQQHIVAVIRHQLQ